MEKIFNLLNGFFVGTDSTMIILILIFMATFLFILPILHMLLYKENLSLRLSRMLGKKVRNHKGDSLHSSIFQNESNTAFFKFIKFSHKFANPNKEESRIKIRKKLLQAGFRSKQAYQNYLASKVFLGLLLPSIYLLVSIIHPLTDKDLNIYLILIPFGFFIPNFLLLWLVQKRQQRIIRAFPDALDLMVVCVEAGLGLDMIFKRVGDEMQPLCRDLSEEYQLATLEVQAGVPRDKSLTNIAVRTGVPEIANLMTILIQTNKLGTSLAKTLRVHAESMRTKRRQLAEERAAKVPVKLVVPLIAFILPALFVVLGGPAAIRVINTLLPAMARH